LTLLSLLLLYQAVSQPERFREIIATYGRHGWQLRRVLVCEETRRALSEFDVDAFENVKPEAAAVDALWFARPSHAGREAWELRFVGETPYALFETFEADEAEEAREEMRREMEARLREYVSKG
jgi:hypothetical protein